VLPLHRLDQARGLAARQSRDHKSIPQSKFYTSKKCDTLKLSFIQIADNEKHTLYFDKAVAKLNDELQEALKGTSKMPEEQPKSKKQVKSKLINQKLCKTFDAGEEE